VPISFRAHSCVSPDLEVFRGQRWAGTAALSLGSVSDLDVSQGDGLLTIVGARLLVALEGRSLETTGRLIQCRAARAAVEGGDTDPFAVPGASARVSPGDAGWAVVELVGRDSWTGEEIARRVRGARAP
jgi:hypothetical protein